MNILIVGYGKMGHAVEEILKRRGHLVAGRIDPPSGMGWMGLDMAQIDCAIEFSTPETGPENVRQLIQQGVPVVCGTTGWNEKLKEMEDLVTQKQGAFVYGSNFSPGVNLLFRMNKLLAGWMQKMPDYDCYIEERHHRNKKDAPSGTGLSLANQVIENHSGQHRWVSAELQHRAPEKGEISMGWVRAGAIPGDHMVAWTSSTDELRISHSAFGREGFATGAVMAAEWLYGKKGFHNFTDIFSEIL